MPHKQLANDLLHFSSGNRFSSALRMSAPSDDLQRHNEIIVRGLMVAAHFFPPIIALAFSTSNSL